MEKIKYICSKTENNEEHNRYFCIEDIAKVLEETFPEEWKHIRGWKWNSLKKTYRDVYKSYVREIIFLDSIPKIIGSDCDQYLSWSKLLYYLPKLKGKIKKSNKYLFILNSIDYVEGELDENFFIKTTIV